MKCDSCKINFKDEFLKKVVIDEGDKVFLCEVCRENFEAINILNSEGKQDATIN